MTVQDYEHQIIRAVLTGDKELISLLARIVKMSHEAKNSLRLKGYGWTGLDLLETVKLVDSA